MARKKWISRTIVGTEAKFMCVDTKAQKVIEMTVTFGGEFKDENALMKAAAKSEAFAEFIKPAKVMEYHKIEKLYAVTEEQFLNIAVECDPTTRKPLGETDAEVEEATVSEN